MTRLSQVYGESYVKRNRTDVQSIARAAMLAGILFLTAGHSVAQETLSLQDAFRLATTDEPGQISLLYRSQALQQQAAGADELPDPVLKFGMVNLPTDSFDFEQEAMTQLLVGIRQSFPKGNTLRYRSDVLRTKAKGAEHGAADRQRQVGLMAQKAWLETYYWEQAATIIKKNRRLFAQLVKVTESLFSVGRKTESDLIRAQLELSRLDLRLISSNEKIRQNRALLGQWLGDDSAAQALTPLAQFELTTPLFELEKKLEFHPKITAAATNIKAAEYAEKLASEQFKPGFGLDLSYGLRGNDRPDLASLVVTVDMPLFGNTKQNAEQQAAIRSTESEKSRRVEIYRQLRRELQVLYSRLQELTTQQQLFDQRILPQARQQSKASLAAYQSDRGDFPSLMRAYINELSAELEYRRLAVDHHLAIVAIESLIGETL